MLKGYRLGQSCGAMACTVSNILLAVVLKVEYVFDVTSGVDEQETQHNKISRKDANGDAAMCEEAEWR